MNDLSCLLAVQAPPLHGNNQTGTTKRSSEKNGTAFADLLKVKSRSPEAIPEHPHDSVAMKKPKVSASKSKVEEDQKATRSKPEKPAVQDEGSKPEGQAVAQSAVPTAAPQPGNPPQTDAAGTEQPSSGEVSPTAGVNGQPAQTQSAAGQPGAVGKLAVQPDGGAAGDAAEIAVEAGLDQEAKQAADPVQKKADGVETAAGSANGKASAVKVHAELPVEGFNQVLEAAQSPNPAAGETQPGKSPQPGVPVTSDSTGGPALKTAPQAILQNQEEPVDHSGQSTPAAQITSIPMVVEYRGERAVAESSSIGLARMAEARSAEIIKQVTSALDTMATNGQHTLRLQLNPDDLGRIDLRMTTAQNGLHVVISADQASTGKMLASEINQLRQSLQDAGVQLAQVSVGQHGAQERSQGQSDQGRSQTHGKTNRVRTVQSVSLQNEDSPVPLPTSDHSQTLVDYQV